MGISIPIVATLVASALDLPKGDDPLDRFTPPPVMYYIKGNTLYTVDIFVRGERARHVYVYDLGGKEVARYFSPSPDPKKTVLFRWRVASDSFWFVDTLGGQYHAISRVPVEDLKFYDPSMLNSTDKLGAKYGGDRHSIPHSWSVEPAQDAADLRSQSKGGIWDKSCFVNFDVLPQSNDACLLFVQDVTSMRVWEGKAEKWDPKVINFRVNYKLVEKFDVGFKEQFTVLAHGGEYLFVTTSGKLYLTEKKAGFRTTKLVWRGDGRPKREPIRVILTDVDAGAVFLFTVTGERDVCKDETFFKIAKGEVKQQFIPDHGSGEFGDGIYNPKLALDLVKKYVRKAK